MTRNTIALGLLGGALLWWACTPPEVLSPVMFLTPRPRTIDNLGEVASLSVYVADAKGAPRTGSVTITARAGAFATGGKTATLDLDDQGRAAVDWSCKVASDAECDGDIRFEARWEQGADFLVQVVRITVGAPQTDGGADGGQDGGSDAGQPVLTIDDSQVLLRGTLAEGACYLDAIADPRFPEVASVGLPCYTGQNHLFGGKFIYIDDLTGTLYRFHGDAFTSSNGRWQYPANVEDNDEVVATTGCTGVTDFWYGPGGQLLYACKSTSALFIDGVSLTPPDACAPVSLGSASDVLYRNCTGAPFGSVAVRDPSDGGALAVLGPDGGALAVGPVRLAADGGWLIAPVATSGTRSLFHVAFDGTAAPIGDYGADPAGFTFAFDELLAPTGVLTRMGRQGNVDMVAEVPLSPGAAGVIYSEANAPALANDFSKSPLLLYVKIHISNLVTGP